MKTRQDFLRDLRALASLLGLTIPRISCSMLLLGPMSPAIHAAVINESGNGTLSANNQIGCVGCTKPLNPGQSKVPSDGFSWSDSVYVGNADSTVDGVGASANSTSSGSYNSYGAGLGTISGTGYAGITGNSTCGISGGVRFCGNAHGTTQTAANAFFTLTSSYAYTLSAFVSSDFGTTPSPPNPNNYVELMKQGSSTPLFLYDTVLNGAVETQSGVLTPGVYTMLGYLQNSGSIVTEGNYYEVDKFSYQLALTPAVPLAAPVWLLLSGLAGLGSLVRRRPFPI